jgi:predicted DNA-binding protein
MKTYDRPVQTFVPPELHCALKIHAAREDKTIAAVVRDLIETHCTERDEKHGERQRG